MKSSLLSRTATAPSRAHFSKDHTRRMPRQRLSDHASSLRKHRNLQLLQHALSSNEVGQQFDGLFGKWTLDEQDRTEVLSYRAGLTVATTALLLDSILALLPMDNAVKASLRQSQNAIALLGATGLGASYFLIHIYVTPLKRFLQALFALGTAGGIYLMLTQDSSFEFTGKTDNLWYAQELPVTEYVASHREAMWLVGPLFASVTGLGIKEGLCYGTPAAAGILLVTPLMCLGHLSGWMPEAGTEFLLVVFNILAVLFASGKYSQTLRGDIGDKTIFQVQALPKEEREQKWAQLESRRETPQ